MPRVLVTEPLAEEGLSILQEKAQVDVRPLLSPQELTEAIPNYHALIVRSKTPVTAEVIAAATQLKVIGRAGVGVDNIDIDAATRRGIVVVNAGGSNTIAVAELTIGLMLALARRIPYAHHSTQQGRWEKKRLMGVQLYGKTLGIIGLGRIGSAVAQRAKALGMKVLAYDPFVSPEAASRQGVELVPLEELLRRADFVSIHVPLTERTRRMIGARELALMKSSAYLINTARGGIVDEEALAIALDKGFIAGAALDVFEHEPPADGPLLQSDRVVLTPHIGASTVEAQRDVAVEVARQVVEILEGKLPRHPVNLPPIPLEERDFLLPYVDLAERMGNLYAQMGGDHILGVELSYSGEIADHNTAYVKAAALKGLLSPISAESVNLVNAQTLAKERGWSIAERREADTQHFTSLITLNIATKTGRRRVSGTVMRGEPHIVCIDDFWLDFVPKGLLLVSEHIEGPGILGRVGTILGDNGINISFVQVGRKGRGERGVMILGVDDPIPPEVMRELMKLPTIRGAWLVRL